MLLLRTERLPEGRDWIYELRAAACGSKEFYPPFPFPPGASRGGAEALPIPPTLLPVVAAGESKGPLELQLGYIGCSDDPRARFQKQ